MDNKFTYSYSAPTEEERKIIERIKGEYTEKTEADGKSKRLFSLHNRVKSIPQIWGLTLGVIGTLIFGLGMTFVLEWGKLLVGIIVGAVGAITCAAAYLVYQMVHQKLKKKYGAEIIRLSEELLGEQEKN